VDLLAQWIEQQVVGAAQLASDHDQLAEGPGDTTTAALPADQAQLLYALEATVEPGRYELTAGERSTTVEVR
jgi:hypothetical protein